MRRFREAARTMTATVLLAAGIAVSCSDWTRADDVSDRQRDLRIVSSAIQLEGECVGITCTRSAYYAAFARIVDARELTLDEIRDAYDSALPAGRIYLGAVILKRDHGRGEAVLRELATSAVPVFKQYGDVVELTTVGAAARFVLANDGLPNFW